MCDYRKRLILVSPLVNYSIHAHISPIHCFVCTLTNLFTFGQEAIASRQAWTTHGVTCHWTLYNATSTVCRRTTLFLISLKGTSKFKLTEVEKAPLLLTQLRWLYLTQGDCTVVCRRGSSQNYRPLAKDFTFIVYIPARHTAQVRTNLPSQPFFLELIYPQP